MGQGGETYESESGQVSLSFLLRVGAQVGAHQREGLDEELGEKREVSEESGE